MNFHDIVVLLLFFSVLSHVKFVTNDVTLDHEQIKQIKLTINRFGMDLLDTLENKPQWSEFGFEFKSPSKSGRNFVISPFAISSVLSMAAIGAAGSTRQEIFGIIGFPNNQSIEYILQGHRQIYNDINNSSTSAVYRTANAIATYETHHDWVKLWSPSYRAKLASFLDSSGLLLHDRIVNPWANSKVNTKILGRLIANNCNWSTWGKKPNTDLVALLLNTAQFSAKWQFEFMPKLVSDYFYANLDEFVSRSMRFCFMAADGHFPYAQFDDGQLVELPYRDSSFSMFVFLPLDNYTKNNFRPISDLLKEPNKSLSSRIAQLRPTELHLLMPKFKFASSSRLASPLHDLGMIESFSSEKANFSGIPADTSRRLHLSELFYAHMFQVNEAGTSIADVIEFGRNSGSCHREKKQFRLKMQHKTMRINRAFVFCVRDNAANVDLFVGVIRTLVSTSPSFFDCATCWN